MNITGLQWNLVWEDRDANYDRVRELLADSGDSDLIILPEMFSSGFSMNVDATAEPDDLPTEVFLRELAREQNAAVLGGLVRRGKGKGHNELITFAPDGTELGRYRKNRTFCYTGESEHYENGTEVSVFEWQDWKIAPLICYDLRFPELFRRATAKGAELIVVIASWPSVRVEHWVTLLRARAIENQAYVIGVNRTGSDPNLEYPGRSIIIDPWGEIVADAGAKDKAFSAEIDLEAVRNWRAEFPALQDLNI
ncbi:carbon-nitrogen family hydrolase [Verrucomicrobiales bacterium]|jgi:omega-amidase|nr:carbon-nitrogen family hydrolase [Verrucomicrobiales bacterium]MDB3939342.1 carbon-nitrogen family hydrolase [Verrucomicrobiales bacterium]